MIPTTIPGSTLDDEKFLIRDRDEIIRLLSSLAQRGVTLSAIFDDGEDLLLSAVVAVEADENAVYLDPNANAQANARLLASKRPSFIAQQEGVTIRWTGEQLASAEYAGRPAFRAALPETLWRIQRRGSFRVATPVSHPVMCRIPVKPRQVLELALADISIEGICIHLSRPPEPVFLLGARFDGCTMELPEVGRISVDLVVQSVWEVEMRNGRKESRAGLHFVDLRPRTQAAIQRYVIQCDRKRIATLPKH